MTLRIITAGEVAANAAKLWRDQYFERQGNKWFTNLMSGENTEEIYERLRIASGNPEAVAAAVGKGVKSSWSHVFCKVCQEFKDIAIEVAGEFNDEPSVCVCLACLKSAQAALESVIRFAARTDGGGQ